MGDLTKCIMLNLCGNPNVSPDSQLVDGVQSDGRKALVDFSLSNMTNAVTPTAILQYG